MYNYVEKAEVSRYRSECAKILESVRRILKENYDIFAKTDLVGSGARNLVTRDGNGPFDLDYNLQIITMPRTFRNDLHALKETVKAVLNQVVQGTYFSDGHDSTSVLTSILFFRDNPSVQFKFDVALLTRNEKGTWQRLIHNKNAVGFGQIGQYTWCPVPNSKDVSGKAKAIKDCNMWDLVRNNYLDRKNYYLEKQDKDHPSFVCYVEAVNQVYYQLFGKGGNNR